MPSSPEEYLERMWEMMSGEDGGSGIKTQGGGGGGAATIADGADVAKGHTTDPGITTDANGTEIGFLRGIVKLILAKLGIKASSGDLADGALVTLGAKADNRSAATDTTPVTEMQVLKEISYMEQNPASQAVTGTFYPVTQPISAASGQFVAGSIADGANVVEGTKADVPVDVVEDITARTGISLWKGIKNYLKSILDILGATNGAAVITDANGTVQQYLRGLVKLIVAKITVILDATENHIGIVSGQGSAVSAEITRPGGATPYAVNDVIGYTAGAALIPFTNIARVNGGTGYIVKARLMTSQKTNVASYRLHLYADNTPTPIADNALFTLLWANRAVRVGYIDLQNMGTEDPTGSDCAVAFTGDIRLHFTAALASRTLYGVLETKSVFTPDAAQVFFIELETELD